MLYSVKGALVHLEPNLAVVECGGVGSNRFTTLDYGAIITEAGTPFEQRLLTIYEDLTAILERHHPDALSVEKLFFTNNQKTAIAVAEARGVILLAATRAGVPVYEYTPLQVKQAVVGYGKAIKAQVMDMTRRLLNLRVVPKPDDTADALALAICHAHVGPSLINEKLLKGMLK